MTHGASNVPAPALTEPEERLQALEAQIAQLQQSAQLFEHSPTAAVVLDAQGRMVRVNGRAAELLRSPAAALVGRPLAQQLPPSSHGTLSVLLGRAQKTGTRQLGEIQGPSQALLLELVVHPSSGEGPLYHLTLTDVTDFKGAHQHLMAAAQDHTQQLQAAAQKLRETNDEFEQVMNLSRQHLQERLTRAQNFLALYRQQARAEDLSHVEEAVLQTQNLLESLDRYLQTRFMRTRLRSVNLGQVWKEVLKDARQQCQGRDVQITAAPLPVVQGDSQVFRLVLREYLTNALKFTRTREQTRLRLLVQETADEYRIGLEDNGVGFNMRSKDRVFRLFGTLHASDLYEGTGLGLATVQRICGRFGSRTWAEGKVGQGATFWFSWPKTFTGD